MARVPLLLAWTIAALAAGSALAQQRVQPLPKVGGWPWGTTALAVTACRVLVATADNRELSSNGQDMPQDARYNVARKLT